MNNRNSKVLPIIVFTKMNIVKAKGLTICLGITSNIDYFGTRHVFITYKHIIIYTRHTRDK